MNVLLLLLKVRGAITAAFVQPWSTWETMEKRIQEAKAQRQLYNQSAKSDLAEEVLKILDDERVTLTLTLSRNSSTKEWPPKLIK